MSKNVVSAMTFISDGTQILGDIKVEHDLRIEGQLRGNVSAGGMLVLGPTGKIEGEVHVRSATIAGQIVGDLKALEKIVLESKSILKGDLHTRELVINEGAMFQGNCSMEMNEKGK